MNSGFCNPVWHFIFRHKWNTPKCGLVVWWAGQLAIPGAEGGRSNLEKAADGGKRGRAGWGRRGLGRGVRGEVNSIYEDTESDMFVELSKYFSLLFKLTFVFSCFISKIEGITLTSPGTETLGKEN